MTFGKLVLGNKIEGGIPAMGRMRMFRYGKRWLSEYEYDTLDLTKLGGAQQPKRIKVNEVERFFDRAGKGKAGATVNDPRMTTGAVAFAPMDSADYQKLFYKDDAENFADDFSDASYRTWGAQTAEQESIGLQFRLTQLDHDTVAYFDNARFMISNILWEFSPDGGRGTWYQLYELPNRARTRITLPEPTNQIRLRAISNNPEEWVQAVAVSPRLDWQNRWVEELHWMDGGFSVDFSGYVMWPEAHGGRGDVIYSLYAQYEEDGSTVTERIAQTKQTRLAPSEYELPDGFSGQLYVTAHDALSTVVSEPIDYTAPSEN